MLLVLLVLASLTVTVEVLSRGRASAKMRKAPEAKGDVVGLYVAVARSMVENATGTRALTPGTRIGVWIDGKRAPETLIARLREEVDPRFCSAGSAWSHGLRIHESSFDLDRTVLVTATEIFDMHYSCNYWVRRSGDGWRVIDREQDGGIWVCGAEVPREGRAMLERIERTFER